MSPWMQAVLLQIGARPCQPIADLGLIALVLVVQLGQDVLGELLQLDDLLVDLVDRPGPAERLQRAQQRIDEPVECGQLVGHQVTSGADGAKAARIVSHGSRSDAMTT
jgi:hypothetical protein